MREKPDAMDYFLGCILGIILVAHHHSLALFSFSVIAYTYVGVTLRKDGEYANVPKWL